MTSRGIELRASHWYKAILEASGEGGYFSMGDGMSDALSNGYVSVTKASDPVEGMHRFPLAPVF